MVNDRGDIKWTSLMLPEHVQMIKDMWAEDEKKEMPILDEQQIEENMMKLQLAIHNNLRVEVKYFKNHGFHVTKGKLKTIIDGKYIVFANGYKVRFCDVVDVVVY